MRRCKGITRRTIIGWAEIGALLCGEHYLPSPISHLIIIIPLLGFGIHLTMDPVTAVATVVSLLDISLRTTSALISFAQDTQNASRDRTILAEECLSLSRLLERLQDRAQNAQIDNKMDRRTKGTFSTVPKSVR